jgi:hypothetical protein
VILLLKSEIIDRSFLSYLTSWFQLNESLGRSVAHFEDKDGRRPGDGAVGRRKLLKYKEREGALRSRNTTN